MIELTDIQKSYDGQFVLNHLNLSFQRDRIYCLMGPSGRGKTTLLRLLAGLEKPDSGKITGISNCRVSMVFQEDRLFPEMSAVRNLQLVGIEHPQELLQEILPADALSQPVTEFSGGMKRRVAVARAIGVKSDVLFMDEPFNGLDESTKELVIRFIQRHRQNRLLIISTHNESDARKLGAEIVRL